jgi:tRNA(Ile2)-agmatinylcytidine synthase
MDSVALKGQRGLIGALAAIGGLQDGDYTFELIAYRLPENRGTARMVSRDSVLCMDKKTYPQTFNNIDSETGRVLITPRGPDPILYGIRGESPESLLEARNLVDPLEEIERWLIFRTNQGTDCHLTEVNAIREVHPYQSIVAQGWVNSSPRTIIGGHVIFSLRDGSGEVDCAAYEPTGGFRNVVKTLLPGDYLQVHGGVRPSTDSFSKTVNLEKLRVLELAPDLVTANPQCPSCFKRMKSMGRGQGFRCERCGMRLPPASKVQVSMPRTVRTGLYIPPPRAHRHLTKPLSRYGLEKNGGVIQPHGAWHYP